MKKPIVQRAIGIAEVPYITKYILLCCQPGSCEQHKTLEAVNMLVQHK